MGEGSNRLAKEVATAPAVQVANDARLKIESKAVKVTPAPEPEPEPEPEPAVETTASVTATSTAAEATPDYRSDGSIGAQAISIAMQYIGIAYAYGGSSPATGFDCSGLIKYVYAQLGVELPHSSSSMVATGYQVSSPIPGDIVWTQGHVSLYAGDGMVVEAANYGSPVRYTEQWQDYAVYIRPY
ncbi:C40 family peptidase [Promicromonospora kroppenstedtii]|uniref:C40 family peptidase n=1 Tax=Promicromonospora kroppenstedtii TaxID=440482 RepID=UPI00146FB69F|nr:C40 family peptidase [Promicromonospora kroppenstedtii]